MRVLIRRTAVNAQSIMYSGRRSMRQSSKSSARRQQHSMLWQEAIRALALQYDKAQRHRTMDESICARDSA